MTALKAFQQYATMLSTTTQEELDKKDAVFSQIEVSPHRASPPQQ